MRNIFLSKICNTRR